MFPGEPCREECLQLMQAMRDDLHSAGRKWLMLRSTSLRSTSRRSTSSGDGHHAAARASLDITGQPATVHLTAFASLPLP